MKRSDIKIPFSQALEKYLTAREEAERAVIDRNMSKLQAALEDMQESAGHMNALTSNKEESKWVNK